MKFLHTSEFGFCLFFTSSRCIGWSKWWTLETTAASLLASSRLKRVCMMSLHHGKWMSSFGLKKKESVFVIFGTSMMILHNTTLQRPFPKLKKHHPTNIYMIYPMAQSVLLIFVEIGKKKAPQWHCPLSSSSHHHEKAKSFCRAGRLLKNLY